MPYATPRPSHRQSSLSLSFGVCSFITNYLVARVTFVGRLSDGRPSALAAGRRVPDASAAGVVLPKGKRTAVGRGHPCLSE